MDTQDLLRGMLPCWDRLTQGEQLRLAEGAALRRYRPGETVCDAQNDCVGVLLVNTGELRAFILSEELKEITLYRLYPGDVCVLCASCLLRSITFDVCIAPEMDSELLVIHSAVFAQLQSENVYIENFALAKAVERFSDVMWTFEQMLFMRLDRRLASFLFDEAAKAGTPALALTHEQIAKYLGSAREVISRALKQLALEGVLSLHRGGLTILDMEKLKSRF